MGRIQHKGDPSTNTQFNDLVDVIPLTEIDHESANQIALPEPQPSPQHGLSLDHPKLPSEQIPLQNKDFPLPIVHTAQGSPIPVESHKPAWERLISHGLLPQEATSLIEEILTSKDEVNLIRDLRGDDAQTFIDALDKVYLVFFPS